MELTLEQQHKLGARKQQVAYAMYLKTVVLMDYIDELPATQDEFAHVEHNIDELLNSIDELY